MKLFEKIFIRFAKEIREINFVIGGLAFDITVHRDKYLFAFSKSKI